MHVIPREQFKGYLTGTSMDPDQNTPELGHHADVILANSQATHFLVLDCENGNDPDLGYPSYGQVSQELLDEQNGPNGYYGVSYQQNTHDTERSAKVFNCWLGGSSLQSAAGYIVAEVTVE